MGNRIVICNTSPIINLLMVDRFDLLKLLFEKIIIPHAVYDELILDPKGKKQLESFIQNGTIEVRKVVDINLVKALRDDLDHGESEVIALAIELNADLVIIDEMEARKKSELFNLKKTGFIGLLIQANRLNHIDSIVGLLDLAIQKGFWINRNLYKRIISDFT